MGYGQGHLAVWDQGCAVAARKEGDVIADIAAVAILAVLVLAGLGQARRATRLDRTKPPAGEARATGSQLPPPGPSRDPQLPVPGHRTPVTTRIHVHECGCVWTWEAGGKWARTVNCERLDEEIRRLTQ